MDLIKKYYQLPCRAGGTVTSSKRADAGRMAYDAVEEMGRKGILTSGHTFEHFCL